MNFQIVLLLISAVLVPTAAFLFMSNRRERIQYQTYKQRIFEGSVAELAVLCRNNAQNHLPATLVAGAFTRDDWSEKALHSEIAGLMARASQYDNDRHQLASREGALFACYEFSLVAVLEELERRIYKGSVSELAMHCREKASKVFPEALRAGAFLRNEWSAETLHSEIADLVARAMQYDVERKQVSSGGGAVAACSEAGLFGILKELKRRIANNVAT